MNIARFLARTALAFPDRPAIQHGDRCLFGYREFAARAARIAGALRAEHGLVDGDRVVIFMRNCPEYLEVLYAIWWAGLVAVPVNAKLHPREVAIIMEDAGASAVFVSNELSHGVLQTLLPAPSVQRVFIPGTPEYEALLAGEPQDIRHRSPENLAWLFYTSGTTGRPKGVMLSHRNLCSMVACYFADVDDVSGDDAIVYAAPMSHGAGLYNFMHVIKGARHVVPKSGGFDEAELVGLASGVGRLSMFAAPTMVKRLVDHVDACGSDVSGFKTIVYGGGPMYVEDIRRALDVMGDRFVQIYGQGESPMTITVLSRQQLADRQHPRWAERIASVGIAQSLVDVRVAGKTGDTLPAGETGEVLVRGDAVMTGYWRNPAASGQAIRDGWLWTGDMGAMDEEGFLTLRDRSKDMIISGGSNIYPREVEEVLLRHPAVREVSVVGKPDTEWGEMIVAFVVADEGLAGETLDALCLEHIARFKRPKEYHFIAELPKNNYGKVLKTELRQRLLQQ
jgi:long-chain acyl-CoA synthetase